MNPKCEVCGAFATVMVRDYVATGMEIPESNPDIAFQESRPGTVHWFCEKHRRNPQMEKDLRMEEK